MVLAPFLNISLVKVYYLLTSLLLGPGLVVESFLKTFSGRARPKEIIEFGGEATFSSALVFSDQCLRNCSFVSGHAAIAFWLTAYAFIFFNNPDRQAPRGGARIGENVWLGGPGGASIVENARFGSPT